MFDQMTDSSKNTLQKLWERSIISVSAGEEIDTRDRSSAAWAWAWRAGEGGALGLQFTSHSPSCSPWEAGGSLPADGRGPGEPKAEPGRRSGSLGADPPAVSAGTRAAEAADTPGSRGCGTLEVRAGRVPRGSGYWSPRFQSKL